MYSLPFTVVIYNKKTHTPFRAYPTKKGESNEKKPVIIQMIEHLLQKIDRKLIIITYFTKATL